MDTSENYIRTQANKCYPPRTQNQNSEVGITSESRKNIKDRAKDSICRTEVPAGESGEEEKH